VHIVGDSPVANALRELAPSVGFAVGGDDPFAVVVASLGHGDEEALAAALASDAEYVGLVASRKRGAAVLEAIGAGRGTRARRPPAWTSARGRTPRSR
jgi:xanthine dehydrogenase accessory factor